MLTDFLKLYLYVCYNYKHYYFNFYKSFKVIIDTNLHIAHVTRTGMAIAVLQVLNTEMDTQVVNIILLLVKVSAHILYCYHCIFLIVMLMFICRPIFKNQCI